MIRRIFWFYLIVFLVSGHKYAVAKKVDVNQSLDFENVLRTVLLDTLQSLDNYNTKLAHYFVEHHPGLAPVYNQMKIEKKATSVDNQQARAQGVTTAKTGFSESFKSVGSPVYVEMAEFNDQPQQNKMHAKNIATGSLTASKVASGAVHAKQIIADEVVVTGNNRQINNFRFNKNFQENPSSFSFQKHDSGNGFGFSDSNNRQAGNRLRNKRPIIDTIARRKQYPGRRKENSNVSLSSKSNSKRTKEQISKLRRGHMHFENNFRISSLERTPPTQRSTVTKLVKPQKKSLSTVAPKRVEPKVEPIFDDWSDTEETEEEYYYDDETSSVEESSATGNAEITAQEIVAGSMFADSVKAKQVHVRNIIADDVVVSGSLGR